MAAIKEELDKINCECVGNKHNNTECLKYKRFLVIKENTMKELDEFMTKNGMDKNVFMNHDRSKHTGIYRHLIFNMPLLKNTCDMLWKYYDVEDYENENFK
jgi:hypothetical protein